MYRALAAVISLSLGSAAFGHGEEHHHDHGSHSAPARETAFGRAADPARAGRTIRIEMRDTFQFVPGEIEVRRGEIVRFVVANAGEQMHEMVLGTRQELGAHDALMRKNPGGMHHDEPGMAHVAPGQSGVIGWEFTQAGEFFFGCLIDDHFQNGMIGRIRVVEAAAAPHPQHEHVHQAESHADRAGHGTMEMKGWYGPYGGSREASGTSWQPDAAPHEGIHGKYGEWDAMAHGFAHFVYDRQGGPRGASKSYVSSMFMAMLSRPVGEGGTLGFRAMLSGDPLFGKRGYPLLLQTGETADGSTPLVDRQHPHDLFMELSASYSRRLSETSSVFVYFGLPGEPALGPPAFMHRFSGEDNPEAPITHHWLDSTHITYGVATLGYVLGNVKLEGSLFRGREPDESRFDVETGSLDSASGRLSWNPTRNWALQASRGHIRSPEQLHPDENVARTTASAIYHRDVGAARWQTTVAWGRNGPTGGAETTNAYLLESALSFAKTHTFFTRAESGDKNELFQAPDPRDHDRFRVGKLSVGYLYDLPAHGHLRIGIGGLVSRYSIPAALQADYGSHPTSFMLFARLKIQ